MQKKIIIANIWEFSFSYHHRNTKWPVRPLSARTASNPKQTKSTHSQSATVMSNRLSSIFLVMDLANRRAHSIVFFPLVLKSWPTNSFGQKRPSISNIYRNIVFFSSSSYFVMAIVCFASVHRVLCLSFFTGTPMDRSKEWNCTIFAISRFSFGWRELWAGESTNKDKTTQR